MYEVTSGKPVDFFHLTSALLTHETSDEFGDFGCKANDKFQSEILVTFHRAFLLSHEAVKRFCKSEMYERERKHGTRKRFPRKKT